MKWVPNIPITLALILALLFVLASVYREGFVPEFLEQGNVKRTAETKNSSYEQRTNHVRPDGSLNLPPVQGVESPFRVNMVNSYIP